MRKILGWGLFLGLFLSSCLTIEESYYFRRDGSGSMRFSVDLTELGAILNYAEAEGSTNVLTDLSFIHAVKQLRQLEGIYNVILLDDPENYIWGVEYEFVHTVALNQALAILLLQEIPDNPDPFVEYHGRMFRQNHRMDKLLLAEKLDEDESLASLSAELKDKMHYRIHYHFDRPIKAVYAQQDIQLPKRRTKYLQFESTFWEMEQNPRILDATLILK